MAVVGSRADTRAYLTRDPILLKKVHLFRLYRNAHLCGITADSDCLLKLSQAFDPGSFAALFLLSALF